MLILLNLLSSFLHSSELLFEALPLLLAALLELGLCFCQTSLLLDQSLDYDDFVLLDCAGSNLLIETLSLRSNFFNLILILAALILELINLCA